VSSAESLPISPTHQIDGPDERKQMCPHVDGLVVQGEERRQHPAPIARQRSVARPAAITPTSNERGTSDQSWPGRGRHALNVWAADWLRHVVDMAQPVMLVLVVAASAVMVMVLRPMVPTAITHPLPPGPRLPPAAAAAAERATTPNSHTLAPLGLGACDVTCHVK
jgi:hypothetical protein